MQSYLPTMDTILEGSSGEDDDDGELRMAGDGMDAEEAGNPPQVLVPGDGDVCQVKPDDPGPEEPQNLRENPDLTTGTTEQEGNLAGDGLGAEEAEKPSYPLVLGDGDVCLSVCQVKPDVPGPENSHILKEDPDLATGTPKDEGNLGVVNPTEVSPKAKNPRVKRLTEYFNNLDKAKHPPQPKISEVKDKKTPVKPLGRKKNYPGSIGKKKGTRAAKMEEPLRRRQEESLKNFLTKHPKDPRKTNIQEEGEGRKLAGGIEDTGEKPEREPPDLDSPT